ncbi:MAG: hypothetical protein HY298_20225 [Verrucomicrobia bacterium]|nr:hypothetical protein [Verrucomicrobiota bacterium]
MQPGLSTSEPMMNSTNEDELNDKQTVMLSRNLPESVLSDVFKQRVRLLVAIVAWPLFVAADVMEILFGQLLTVP